MPAARSRLAIAVVVSALSSLTLVFAALGGWQIERRTWKIDLIARVDRRIAAAPVPAPGLPQWVAMSRETDEYRRVRVSGRFIAGHATLVFASTRLGPGYWQLEPFRDARGFTVLVNRGYVPAMRAVPTSAEPQALTGLLRLSEPGGDLLRSNDAAADRWYSRDVAAIGRARRLGAVAPYFIDAEAAPDAHSYPRGGLTVVAFPNNHLAYALTWFTLMALSGWATVILVRRSFRPDRP